MNWTDDVQRRWDSLTLGERDRLLELAKSRAAAHGVRRLVLAPDAPARSVRRSTGAPWPHGNTVRRSTADDEPIEWTARHQALWDKLEAVDPITPDGERAYARRQADQEYAELSRARREEGYELRNLRARLAGAVTAARRRARQDPGGFADSWGAFARESDQGRRFVSTKSEDWRA